MPNGVSDILDDTTTLAVLAAVGIGVYFLYRFFNQSNCGLNKDQKCCRASDVNTSACVLNSDGVTPCGLSDFLSFNCFSPAGSQTNIDNIRSQSSVSGGVGEVLSPSAQAPVTTTPGLPVGYDPATGTIDASVANAGTPTAGTPVSTTPPVTGSIPPVLDPNATLDWFSPTLGQGTPCSVAQVPGCVPGLSGASSTW